MVRGAYDTGHFALDDFTFTKVTECSLKPSYARIPTNESKIIDSKVHVTPAHMFDINSVDT